MDSNVISPAMSESRNKQLWPHGASPRNAEKNVVSAGWVPPSTDPGRKQANERPGNWGQGICRGNKQIGWLDLDSLPSLAAN